ncbi:hypothetical protein TSUD_203450 [Trifolium subterraneum]|uniref:Uncharacterized protein n=1 Tax=Trifolium subterraneum TaxID=3900 RepID=A0A2Z6LHU8_TRISU|nr:hypothetical protein TSUD_203450 [Trifolium subterraneum]
MREERVIVQWEHATKEWAVMKIGLSDFLASIKHCPAGDTQKKRGPESRQSSQIFNTTRTSRLKPSKK